MDLERGARAWGVVLGGLALLGLLVPFAAGLGSCTDARLQYEPAEEQVVYDNLLKVEGSICTYPADNVTFPVKILFLLDASASLQCTDPMNIRYTALNEVVQGMLAAPNVHIGAVAFASFSRRLNFTQNAQDITSFLNAPENQNGTATDYQGALATAVQMIEQDMIAVGAAERARSRYIVVMVSDGLPMPTCLPGCEDDIPNCTNGDDDDGDGLADGADPDCANINDNVLHPDNLSGVCNTDPAFRRDRVDPDLFYVDMQGICPAYNQPEQLMARVEDLMALKDAYSSGELSLHSVFLFAPEAVVASRCTAQYAQLLGGDRDTAVAMMQSMSDAGNGIFRDVNTTTGETDFLEFDYTSLESVYWMTEMLAVNQHAVPTVDAMVPDSDMDGIPDLVEDELGTNWLEPDSDVDAAGVPTQDGYRDFFEDRYDSSGFDPVDPNLPSAPCTDTADLDGDGLNGCEENFMGTGPRLPDTDGDRIPDGIELRAGTDPLRDDSQEDPDFDGLSNRDEIRARTMPLVPDMDRYRTSSIRYGLDDLGQHLIPNLLTGELELRRCYDFRVSRIELVPTPLPSDRGLNRILIYAMQEPVQLVGARPITQVACVEAYYQGETTKDPPSGVIELTQEYWDTVAFAFQAQFDAIRDECATNGRRGGLINRMRECMPAKIQVGKYLFTRDELEDLVRKYADPDLIMRIPITASDIFVDLEIFDPDTDCHRPWEISRLQQLLNDLRDECRTCPAVTGG
ncbi:MAG: VWA domain-containing protein [Deltaproteobacteria bacterium]|nr:VWA domain-containing protein [Deltaproteobacteria bacterium]